MEITNEIKAKKTKTMKFKNIKNNGRTFLLRLGMKCGNGSLKVHIILDDDVRPHSHPWDFTSLILFGGYREAIKVGDNVLFQNFGWLSLNRKRRDVMHQISLRRVMGRKVPVITIGYYGEKKELCSLCKELGYCRTNSKPKK